MRRELNFHGQFRKENDDLKSIRSVEDMLLSEKENRRHEKEGLFIIVGSPVKVSSSG